MGRLLKFIRLLLLTIFAISVSAAAPATARVASLPTPVHHEYAYDVVPTVTTSPECYARGRAIAAKRPGRPAVNAPSWFRGASHRCVTTAHQFVATNTADDLAAGAGKVPGGWGAGAPNKKGVGTRWTDPDNAGNGVRVDAGNPANSQVTQQVDHVVVRYNGQVIGRDGRPITGSIANNPSQAHIPLSEWLTWKSWFKP